MWRAFESASSSCSSTGPAQREEGATPARFPSLAAVRELGKVPSGGLECILGAMHPDDFGQLLGDFQAHFGSNNDGHTMLDVVYFGVLRGESDAMPGEVETSTDAAMKRSEHPLRPVIASLERHSKVPHDEARHLQQLPTTVRVASVIAASKRGKQRSPDVANHSRTPSKRARADERDDPSGETDDADMEA